MSSKEHVRATRVPIQTLVLRTLAVTGVIGIALVAPHTLRLFKYLDRSRQTRTRTYNRIRQALTRLERKGLVSFSKEGTELTKAGTDAMQKILAYEYQIEEPAFWDGRWRIIIFDVKERQRKRRDELRLLLEGAGFIRLQQSVWVHPYSCDEFVELVRIQLSSRGDEMFYFTVEGLQPDHKLREHFGLS